MKTLDYYKMAFTIFFLLNSTSTILGDDVFIKTDGTGTTIRNNMYDSSMYLSSSLTTNYSSDFNVPIYAYTDANTLTLSFDVLVRKMIIAVYNSNNMLMYQRQISTYTQTSLDIDMSSWESDDYTIRISYSNTNFVGEFTLE
ncbi:MAG: DUF3244 domain-containing protein [Paludibacter sp.]